MTMLSQREGYRGYIASRPVRGQSTPQHIQNLVIRDYASKHDLIFKLSATEYAMPECTMILETVLNELSSLDGLIMFSMFQLPGKTNHRLKIYQRILDARCSLHAASENIVFASQEDLRRWEDIILVEKCMPSNITEFL